MPATPAEQPPAPPQIFERGERALIEVMVVEAYSDDCCVRIETGTKGFRQSVWVLRSKLRKIDDQVIARADDPASIMMDYAREG